MKKCVNPNAPKFPCIVCGKQVFTCERNEPINNDYRCPAHPDGVEVEAGWLCSEICWDKFLLKEE